MRARHAERIERAARAAEQAELVALLVPPSPDLAYLIGYDPMPLERPTTLILRPDAVPVLVVPALERPLAAGSPMGSELDLVAWRDGEDPYAVIAGLLPTQGRVGIGERLWANHLLELQRLRPQLGFLASTTVSGGLRAVKDVEELGALRRAGRAADATFDEIVTRPFTGRTERSIAEELAALLVRHGHAEADFTIVASGPHGASPHHEPGTRVIERGDAVVLDFGGRLDGYFSDTSRTVVVGDPPPGFAEVYDLVAHAQQAAVAAVRPGVTARSIDRAARDVIAAGDRADGFVHRTGHGIGLEVHEPPWIVEGNELALAAGMTFSVEPGVYLDGRFGVRIEDIVAVTDDGVERLNLSTRQLQVVD